MYIPLWLLIIGAVVVYWIYNRNSNRSGLLGQLSSIEGIETRVQSLKRRIFNLEHIDSPHFIDVQNAFDSMEINYFRLKQRLIHIPEKVLEIARDWERYAEALGDLKYARVMLDLDWSDEAWDKTGERMKEPSIVKEEVEKKFQSLLGKDWQKIPLDYFKRKETIKLPNGKISKTIFDLDEKTRKQYGLDTGDDWQYYYWGEKNLINLREKRQKEKEEKEKNEVQEEKPKK